MQITRLATLSGHEAAVYTLDAGPETGTAFSAGSDRIVVIWDLIRKIGLSAVATLPSVVYSIKYIREKNILIAGTAAGVIHFIDLDNKKEIKSIQLDSPVFTINYSIRTNRIYAGTGNGTIYILTIEPIMMLVEISDTKGKIRSIQLDSLQEKIYCGCSNGEIIIYDAADARLINRKMVEESAITALLHVNDRLYSGSKNALLKILDGASLDQIKSIPAHNFAVYGLKKVGDQIVSCSRDRTIKIWNKDLAPLLRIGTTENPGHAFSVNTIIGTGNNTFLSAGDDKLLMHWKIEDQ